MLLRTRGGLAIQYRIIALLGAQAVQLGMVNLLAELEQLVAEDIQRDLGLIIVEDLLQLLRTGTDPSPWSSLVALDPRSRS